MRSHAGRREKYPAFVKYANFREEFAVSTPRHHQVTWRLVATFFPGIRWRCGYTPRKIWQDLKTHQPIFRAILDGIMALELTPVQEATIRLHVAHFGPHVRYERSSGQTLLDPQAVADVEWYSEVFEPQDPLDPLYYQLHLFLRNRSPQELRRCRTCGHYFLTVTARRPNYCQDPCPPQAQRVSPEANRRDQENFRMRRKQSERKRVQEAIAHVHARLMGQQDGGVDALKLEDVPEDILAEYVFNEVRTQVNKSHQPNVGPKRCRAILTRELDANAQQRMAELTRRATPQHAVTNEDIRRRVYS